MKRFVVLGVTALFVLSPIAAQDVTPTEAVNAPVVVAVEAPPAENETTTEVLKQVNAALLLGLGVGLLAFAGFAMWALDKIYKSAPPPVVGLIHEGQKAVLDFAISIAEQKKAEAAANDVAWDDPAWAAILGEFKRQRESLADDPLKAQRGVG